MANAKKSIEQARLAMEEQKLTMEQVPLFKELLLDYLKVVALEKPEAEMKEAEYVNEVIKTLT
jgi:hypothetical protein